MSFDHRKSGWAVVALSALISVALGFIYVPMWKDDTILPGPGVTEVKWLSDYLPALKGTLGDTRVFIMRGREPGANFFVLTGDHSDEPAGWLTGLVLVEHCRVKAGKLVVIPQANNSGFTHNYPQEAHSQSITIPLPDGSQRTFRHGSRTSNSAEHWPDPEVFVQYPSGQKLSGDEVRNINRAFPGRMNGTFTERVAYAIQQMVRQEKIDMQVDLHEAQPEYPFVNAMSAHPRAQDLASFAALGMQEHKLPLGVEVSPPTFRGLSNRELGDVFPELLAVTSETVNPNQGKIRGITDAILPVQGRDAFYVAAAKLGNLFVPWDENGWPIKRRVGRNLQEIRELANALEAVADKRFEFEVIPTYDDLMKNDVGHYLNPLPREGAPDPGYRALPGIWRLITQES